jgi:hypothetical protein
MKYRVKFDRLGSATGIFYFALQERRWWGWKTLAVGEQSRVELLRKELLRLDFIEAHMADPTKWTGQQP